MKQRVWIAGIICMLLLSGCSGKKVDLRQVKTSTIGINADGSVDEAVIETFDQAYYSLEELTDYINRAVSDFNADNPQKQPEKQKANAEEVTAVQMQSVTVNETEQTARMELGYLNTELYNTFNGTNIQFDSVAEALKSGSIGADIMLINAKTGESMPVSEITDPEKLWVVLTDSAMRIKTAGKIMYYSQSASLIDKDTVETKDDQTFIVFK